MEQRFGEYLVMNDKIRIGDLVEALKIQVEKQFQTNNEYKKLGEILTQDMKVLDNNEIEALFEQYKKEEK